MPSEVDRHPRLWSIRVLHDLDGQKFVTKGNPVDKYLCEMEQFVLLLNDNLLFLLGLHDEIKALCKIQLSLLLFV